MATAQTRLEEPPEIAKALAPSCRALIGKTFALALSVDFAETQLRDGDALDPAVKGRLADAICDGKQQLAACVRLIKRAAALHASATALADAVPPESLVPSATMGSAQASVIRLIVSNGADAGAFAQ